jgi:hypothetical protein
MCMGSANGWNNPYVFISKVHYYMMGVHLLWTNYIDTFFIEVENFNSSTNCAYKWFYGMWIHYTLQKNAMGHKKWATQSCIQPLKISKCIKWILKLPFWMEIFHKKYIYNSERALWSRVRKTWYVSFKNPCKWNHKINAYGSKHGWCTKKEVHLFLYLVAPPT